MPRKDNDEYNAYMREYMLKRYERRRAEAIATLGDCCSRCGSVEELEFDHLDPEEKGYSIGKILASGSKSRIAEELEKCQLLCSGCHADKTIENEDWASNRYS